MLAARMPVRVSGSFTSSSLHLLNTSEITLSVIESNWTDPNLSLVFVSTAQSWASVFIHSGCTVSSNELNASFCKWFQIISQNCLTFWIGSSFIILWSVLKLSILVKGVIDVNFSKIKGNESAEKAGDATKQLLSLSLSSLEVILNLSFFGGSNSIG